MAAQTGREAIAVTWLNSLTREREILLFFVAAARKVTEYTY